MALVTGVAYFGLGLFNSIIFASISWSLSFGFLFQWIYKMFLLNYFFEFQTRYYIDQWYPGLMIVGAVIGGVFSKYVLQDKCIVQYEHRISDVAIIILACLEWFTFLSFSYYEAPVNYVLWTVMFLVIWELIHFVCYMRLPSQSYLVIPLDEKEMNTSPPMFRNTTELNRFFIPVFVLFLVYGLSLISLHLYPTIIETTIDVDLYAGSIAACTTLVCVSVAWVYISDYMPSCMKH